MQSVDPHAAGGKKNGDEGDSELEQSLVGAFPVRVHQHLCTLVARMGGIADFKAQPAEGTEPYCMPIPG